MEFTLSIIVGYLFGSSPTAYLLMKKTKNIDITNAGTGNVGAMNSYEVSGSAIIGFFVFAIDFLKGFLTVFVLNILFNNSFIFAAIGVVFALFAHCFNPWLNFKGGRGLATAAGSAVLIFPFLLFVWVLLWVIIYIMKKDILFSNIASNILSLFVVTSTPALTVKYSSADSAEVGLLMFFTSSSMLIIIIKHIEPLKEIIKNKTIFNGKIKS